MNKIKLLLFFTSITFIIYWWTHIYNPEKGMIKTGFDIVKKSGTGLKSFFSKYDKVYLENDNKSNINIEIPIKEEIKIEEPQFIKPKEEDNDSFIENVLQGDFGEIIEDVVDIISDEKEKVFFDISAGSHWSSEGGMNHIGRLVFELDSDTPKTAENFIQLSKGWNGFSYQNSKIHRIVPGFVIQGGKITNNIYNSMSIYGHTFEDENLTKKHDKPYLLSMANRGKNTNGSQFFITLGPAPWLDGKHVVFGKLVEGMEVVRKIEKLGCSTGKLKNTVIITNSGIL